VRTLQIEERRHLGNQGCERERERERERENNA
jgi:hypothetical protein